MQKDGEFKASLVKNSQTLSQTKIQDKKAGDMAHVVGCLPSTGPWIQCLVPRKEVKEGRREEGREGKEGGRKVEDEKARKSLGNAFLGVILSKIMPCLLGTTWMEHAVTWICFCKVYCTGTVSRAEEGKKRSLTMSPHYGPAPHQEPCQCFSSSPTAVGGNVTSRSAEEVAL
jgi:hypothetical protein